MWLPHAKPELVTEGTDDAQGPVQRGADPSGPARAGGGGCDGGGLPQAWNQRGDVLQLEGTYGGMDVAEAKRLKALEDENAKLKRLLAEARRDNAD